jgi:hypothetical protein
VRTVHKQAPPMPPPMPPPVPPSRKKKRPPRDTDSDLSDHSSSSEMDDSDELLSDHSSSEMDSDELLSDHSSSAMEQDFEDYQEEDEKVPSTYELTRSANIARNARLMVALGLGPGGAAAAPVPNTQRKRKRAAAAPGRKRKREENGPKRRNATRTARTTKPMRDDWNEDEDDEEEDEGSSRSNSRGTVGKGKGRAANMARNASMMAELGPKRRNATRTARTTKPMRHDWNEADLSDSKSSKNRY